MPIFNNPDFFTVRQLDIENKVVLPTSELLARITFRLDALYQDIRNALIEAHGFVASASKQLYEHPLETTAAWYEQARGGGTLLYADAREYFLPISQNWQATINIGLEKTIQYAQAFWDNPQQSTVAALEPVTRGLTAATDQAGHYLELFTENPEQFLVSAFAPVIDYLTSFTEGAETALINTYYELADLFSLLAAQPSETAQALYHNALSALVDIYFEIISSFLMMA